MVEGIVAGFSSGLTGARRVMPHPFDRGLELVHGRSALLLKLCVAPVLFGFLTSYLDLNFTLTDQQQFLLFAFTVAISAWVLMTTLILSVEWLRGAEPDFEVAAIRALRAMPKVVLSYFALFALVFFGAVILRPLVLFAILFIWAPFFCAGEVFAPAKREDDEDDATEMEIEDGERLYIPRPRWFVSLPPWDLGFARSMMFSVQNFAFTIQFGLLLWVTSVAPLALAVLVSGYHLQFFGLAIRVIAAAIGLQYVLFSASVAFLQLLPKEGAEELGLVRPEGRSGLRSAKLRRQNALAFILLSFIGLASSYVVFNWMDRQFDIPESVVVRSEAVKVENGQLVVSIRLDDPEYRYHWLEPRLFRLRITPEGRADALPAPIPESERDATPNKLAPPPPPPTTLWEPDRVMAYDDKGEVIPEDETSPRRGGLAIAAHLGMPDSFGEKGRVELYYHVPDNLAGAKPLAAGEYRKIPEAPQEP